MPTLTQQTEEALTRSLTFRVTPSLWERVGVVARQNDTSIQSLCTEAIERKLAELEAQKAA